MSFAVGIGRMGAFLVQKEGIRHGDGGYHFRRESRFFVDFVLATVLRIVNGRVKVQIVKFESEGCFHFIE